MKKKIRKKANLRVKDYVAEDGGITLYHGTSAERALSIILNDTGLVKPSVGFYLDALLDSSNPRLKELYEAIKKWSLEEFVNVYRHHVFFFTPDIKRATEYAMQTKAPVVLEIYIESLADAIVDGKWKISGCDILTDYLDEYISIVTDIEAFDEAEVSVFDKEDIIHNGQAVLSLVPFSMK